LYRLDVVAIVIPALRDRREDIPALVEHLLEDVRRRYPHSPVRRLAPAALEALRRRAWPGNVRELANTVEKLVLLGHTEEVTVSELPPELPSDARASSEFRGEILPMRDLERRYAAWAVAQTGGHRGQAAEALGVDPKTLRKWLGEREGD
jgi:two-component system, NtrC family, response regulator HydG